MALSVGQDISHYRLIEKIGEGGMGVVWKAKDSLLGRTVAIKVLPAAVSRELGHRRQFLEEARCASSISGAHIVQVHDFCREEDLDFLVMEYVDGVPLSRTLQGRRLPVSQVLDVGAQIAAALSDVHREGLLHRDLKPGNVILTPQGQVKLVDFGLAMLFQAAESARHADDTTRVLEDEEEEKGKIRGSLHYLSPEQVAQEPLDARSDIFSLGVVLYEMCTGQLPFSGATVSDILQQIRAARVVPVREHVPDIPVQLERIITRALAPAQGERYQTMEDLGADLGGLRTQLETGTVATPLAADGRLTTRGRRWAAGILALAALAVTVFLRFGPSSSPPFRWRGSTNKKIVVLPFENLGPPEEAYFAAGMTGEITSRLGSVRNLGVISSKSALHYGGTDKTMQQVADELSVDYVLEGTVRWARNPDGSPRVRITPQLVRASDDTQVWTDTYDRVLEDIFDVQSEIAARVLEHLHLALVQPGDVSSGIGSTRNTEAYEIYLRGLYHVRKPDFTEDNWRLAVDLFRRATDLDPGFALAWAESCLAHSFLYHTGIDRSDLRRDLARDAVERALEIDPDLPYAHLAKGYYHYWVHRDYSSALEEFTIFEQQQPNNADLFEAKGLVGRRQGRWGDAVGYLERTLELNPRDTIITYELGATLQFVRRYEEADRMLDLTISLDPSHESSYQMKASNYWLWTADLQGASAALEAMPDTGNPFSVWFRVWQKIFEEDLEAALEIIQAMPGSGFALADLPSAPKSLLAAQVYGLLGDRERARTAYEAARQELEERVMEDEADAGAHSALGIAYAGLGLAEEAVREGREAVRLVPLSRDAMEFSVGLQQLALIHTMVGQSREALDRLQELLDTPSMFSSRMLELDPRWAPLRDQPGFRDLVERADATVPAD